MTDSQRRRLTEFLGKKWNRSKVYRDIWGRTVAGRPENKLHFRKWNEVMPLLARLVEVDEWRKFIHFCRCQRLEKSTEYEVNMDFSLWFFGRFTNPEHTARLVSDYLESKEGR